MSKLLAVLREAVLILAALASVVLVVKELFF